MINWHDNALDAAARTINEKTYNRMSKRGKDGIRNDLRHVLEVAIAAQAGRVAHVAKEKFTQCMKKLEWEFKRNQPHVVYAPTHLIEAAGVPEAERAPQSAETRAELRRLHKRIEELEKDQRDEADMLLIAYQDGFYKGRAQVKAIYNKINELEGIGPVADAHRLLKALRPFAYMGITAKDQYASSPDEAVMSAGMWGYPARLTFRLGDIRLALKLVEELEGMVHEK